MEGSTSPRRSVVIRRAGLVALLALIAGLAGAEPIALSDAIDAMIERSVELRQASLRVAGAEIREVEVESSTAPSIELSSDPLYSIVTQRVPEVDSGTVTVAGSDLAIHSTSVGVSLVQPLPTAGIVTGSFDLGFSATRTNPDDGDATMSYALDPAFVLTVSQPLFVGDDFIEAEQPRLILEQARRATRELETAGEIIERGLTALVINLYTQIGTLRRSIVLQNAQRALTETQLEQAIIRRESGLGDRETEIELQVAINGFADRILQSELALAELTLELERLTGLQIEPDDEIEPASELGSRSADAVASAVPTLSPERRAASIVTERAVTDLTLAEKQARMTANAALSLSPRYQDNREAEDELSGVFTDFAGDGAGVDLIFSLGLTVPLGEEGSRARELDQARLALEIAQAEEERLEVEAQFQLELFRTRISSIENRVAFTQFELDFRREQLQNELELIELGVSPRANADTIRSDILSRELALEDLAAQLFLAQMDLAAALGLDLAEVVRE